MRVDRRCHPRLRTGDRCARGRGAVLTSLRRSDREGSGGLLWATELFLLALVAAVSGFFAVRWFDDVMPHPAGSDFHGTVAAGPKGNGPPLDVVVQVPGRSEDDGGGSWGQVDLDHLAKADRIIYDIFPRKGGSQNPFSLEVWLVGDARIVDDLSINLYGGTYTIETSADAQIFHCKVQPRDNGWDLSLSGRPFRRPVARSGAELYATMPRIDVPDLHREGGMPANTLSGYLIGGLPSTAALDWSSQPPSESDMLRWNLHGTDDMDPLEFRLTDHLRAQSLNRELFAAAALVGVAGGAAIEMIARLPVPVAMLARRRRIARSDFKTMSQAARGRRHRMSVKASAPAVGSLRVRSASRRPSTTSDSATPAGQELSSAELNTLRSMFSGSMRRIRRRR